jgi:signal transduction protein with GAF and PtsI domain
MEVVPGRDPARSRDEVALALAKLAQGLERARKSIEPSLPAALALVAREYARAPYRVASAGDPESWLMERAAEVEDLCGLIASGRTMPAPGTIVVGERLTGIGALAAVARRAVGVALVGTKEESGLGVEIARAARLPVVAEVSGLYAWARPDDRMLVDADVGVVRVNPPATVVARFRAKKV